MAVTTETRTRHNIRRWTPLAAVLLAVGVSTAIAFPFLALFLDTEVHAGPVRVTAFLIAAPLSSVVVSTLIGRLSDRRPMRRVLLVAVALAGCLGAGLTAFVRDYFVLLGLTVTATAVAGSLMPQVFAYAREVLQGSPRAAMTMSSLRTLFSIAWVAGPPLAAVLLQTGGFTLVYGSASLMYALAALVAYAWLAPSPAERAGRPDPPGPGEPTGPAGPTGPGAARTFGPDAPRSVILLTVAAFALIQCAGNLGVQAMPLFISQDLGGSVGDAGLILGLCAALEIPLMLGFGALAARFPLRRLMLVGPACSLAYFAVAATAHSTWQLAAGQLLLACSIAVVGGLGVTYVQDMLPRHPGRASTLFSNAFPIGAMGAGPVLGAAQHFGYRSAYATGVVLCAAALGLLLISRPRRV